MGLIGHELRQINGFCFSSIESAAMSAPAFPSISPLVALVLALTGILAGCAPPPELNGRAPTPADAVARSLLPDGRVEIVAFPATTDGARVTAQNGAQLTALRFASSQAAGAQFTLQREAVLARPDIASSTSVDLGSVQYVRYATRSRSGLMWLSANWLFQAEADGPAALAALIGASGAGGVAEASWLNRPTVLLGLVVLCTAVVLALIFTLLRIVLRSTAIHPGSDVPPLGEDVLTRRLLGLNDPGRPWLVRTGPEADLIVEYKYADASWWGILAKSGLRRAYRLRLYLDGTEHCCDALDEFTEVDWSAGLLSAPRLHYGKSFFRGVQLMRKERGIAYGLNAPGGSVGKALDYKFDIDEVKQPVIDAVIGCGWTYRPILFPRRCRG